MVITAIALFALATVAFYKFPELGLVTYFELVRYGFVQALTFLLPLSLLVAVVFVYGRAAADNEINTLKASGIHPYRSLQPGLLLALVLCGAGVEIENRFAPWAVFQQHRLPESQATLKALLEKRIARGEKMVQFGDRHQNRSLHWEQIELGEQGVVLKPVLLEMEAERPKEAGRPRGEPTIIRAEQAVASFDEAMDQVVLRLVKPQVISGPARETAADGVAFTFSLGRDNPRTRLKFQSGRELFALAERGRESVLLGGERLPLLRRFEPAEVVGRIHQRLSRASTPLVFLLLGAPLALVFRSGNRLVAFLLASLIAMFVYYPTQLLADALQNQQLAGPVVACWSGNALLALLGLGLLAFVVRR